MVFALKVIEGLLSCIYDIAGRMFEQRVHKA